MFLDLHTHSMASDGQYTPAELMGLAKKAGLEIIALTDHDTVDGIKEAREAAERIGQPFVAGIEISTCEGEEIHMLGLGIDENDALLCQKTKELMDDRMNRGRIITEYLAGVGVEVDYEKVQELAGEGSVGRPHFAQYLQMQGYVRTRQEAFDRYIDTPSFHRATDRVLPSPQEAVDLIHHAGGKAVLAHPGLLKMGHAWQESLIGKLKEGSLDGLEVYYGKHTKPQEKYYRSLAKRYQLFISAGSDFHGEQVKPNVRLGVTLKNEEEHLILDFL